MNFIAKKYTEKHSYIELILAFLMMILFLSHFYRLYNSMYVVNHALPQELREGVIVKLAVEFAKGNNPYSIGYNETRIPVINHYGWATPFMLSVCLRIFGLFTQARPEIICMLVTLGVIFMGCVAIWATIYIRTNNYFLAMIAAELLLSCNWRFQFNGGIFPDCYGLTLSMLLLWAVETDIKRQNYRYLLYIILILAMFYTKQYFVLSSIGVLLMLIFQNYKIAIKYALTGMIAGGISIILVNHWLPLFFTESILLSGISNTADHDVKYMLMQFQFVFKQYCPVFIVIAAFLICYFIKKDKNDRSKEIFSIFKRYDVVMMLIGAAAIIRIGQHLGAIYTYYLQLWIPYVISVSCTCAHKIIKDSKISVNYGIVYTLVLLLSAPAACRYFLEDAAMGIEDIQSWESTYEVLDRYTWGG